MLLLIASAGWSSADADSFALTDNSANFQTKTKDEAAAVAVIRTLKSAWEKLDHRALEAVLSSNYRHILVTGPKQATVALRADYLADRAAWSRIEGGKRDLSYSIQDVRLDEGGSVLVATALSAYRTIYFEANYLESLVFERIGEKWLLHQQMLMPATTPNLDSGVQIFLVPTGYGTRSFNRVFEETALSHGPDYAIDQFRKSEITDAMPEDEVYRSVLFVFRTPPRVGQVITTEVFWTENGKPLKPSIRTYEIEDNRPFFVIENRIASGGQRGKKRTLTWRVTVDGDVVASKTVTLRNVSDLPEQEMRNGAYMPSDLKVTAPATDVAPALAGLSGIWLGSWGNDVEAAVAFEEVEQSGDMVIALGLDQDVRNFGAKKEMDWFVPHRWFRVEAVGNNDGTVTVFKRETDGDDLTFELRPDGTLFGVFKGEDGETLEGVFEQ